MLSELKHSGQMSPAMYKLAHYFTPFQAYLVSQAEEESGRFTMQIALQVLEAEAKYRIAGAKPAGLFFFHFEVLSRNRLNYDKGLSAISTRVADTASKCTKKTVKNSCMCALISK